VLSPEAGQGNVAPALPGAATMFLRCKAPTHPISPLVYGIGARPTHGGPDPWLLHATARRWGGNHTSRYNWELGNAWNTGKDWFFQNVDYDRAPRPAHVRFIDDDLAHGMATALTVPTIGWVAKDTRSFGFPVSLYGPQAAVAPENTDAGSGVTLRGKLLVPGPPERTSVPMPPSSVGRWARAIREHDGASGRRGVQMYILDNEPTLWSETHRDVHPEPVSYDELLDRTVAYATEIRRADPEALIAGPALWGFPGCFTSGVDKAAHPAHPDRDRHGGVALLPWWLGEVSAQEKRAGVRLIDVVDVHFYPQGQGIGVGEAGATDPGTAARRIRATRALWDPTYVDESWIAEPVRLIPRLEAWIAEMHPGLGISIGEYNFGAEQHMSGGLAVAEALGRFGERGITSAFYWDYPSKGSPAFWAFRAYRDFDGDGGRFLDESVQAESRDPMASVFASRGAGGEHMVVVLLDLDPSRSIAARVDLSSCGRVVTERRFVYVGGRSGLAKAASEPESSGVASVTLPPYSITVLDLHLAP
jgi:Glycoside hydrolase family 44